MAKSFELNEETLILLGLAAFGLYIWNRGVEGAAYDAGKAATDVITGAVKGTVSSIGNTVGLPGVNDVTNDSHVARWILDHPNGGYLSATKWATPLAIAGALGEPVSYGTPPPVGTKAYAAFPPETIDISGSGEGGGW